MTAVILHPNQEIILHKFQNNLIAINNKKEVLITPVFPLWFLNDSIPYIKEQFDCLKEITITSPEINTNGNAITTSLQLTFNENRFYEFTLKLANIEKPSCAEQLLIPQEGFPDKINVLRIADVEFLENSWSAVDSFWKKLSI